MTRKTKSAGHEHRTRGATYRQAGGHGFDQHRNDSTEEKEPDDFSRSPGCGKRKYQEDGPQQFVFSESQLRQLERGTCDDSDHCRANPIEHSLHPWKSAKPNVCSRKAQHHHERRQDESDPDGSRTNQSGMNVSQVNGKLRRKRTRSKLGKREPLQVVFLPNPSATVDQILLHVACKRYGSSKSDRAEPQEISCKTHQRDALLLSVPGGGHGCHFAEFV